jgi:hypothetical protein
MSTIRDFLLSIGRLNITLLPSFFYDGLVMKIDTIALKVIAALSFFMV